jgi:hypothetical protein
MRLALRGVPLIVATLWAGSARAEDQSVQDKVVQLNNKALADVDALDWDDAKRTLLNALLAGKKGGLDNHPLMARTYVHLGVVYITGFKNRDKAVQCFMRALEIQPDITLSVGKATNTELEEAFREAAARPILGEAAAPRRRVRRPAAPVHGFDDSDLPVRINALDCPVADQTRVDEAVPVRCALQPSIPATKVFLIYREPSTQGFSEVEMKRSPKGWFQGRIPERVIYGQSVQFYFEARNDDGKPIVRNGEELSPYIIAIVKR